MFRRLIRSTTRAVKNIVFLMAAIMLLPRLYTTIQAQPHLNSVQASDAKDVGIVYGAALRRDGKPSAVLRDRIFTAVELYQQDKVNKLLMSGHIPEPAAMRDYAISLGVDPEDILLDEGGLRTYDTCYRAKSVYKLDEAILVTQQYHLPRALYLCNTMGVDASGVPARQSRYWRGALVFWQIRESFATVVALWEVHITKPTPTITELLIAAEGR